jgi:hypothetical protein
MGMAKILSNWTYQNVRDFLEEKGFGSRPILGSATGFLVKRIFAKKIAVAPSARPSLTPPQAS